MTVAYEKGATDKELKIPYKNPYQKYSEEFFQYLWGYYPYKGAS